MSGGTPGSLLLHFQFLLNPFFYRRRRLGDLLSLLPDGKPFVMFALIVDECVFVDCCRKVPKVAVIRENLFLRNSLFSGNYKGVFLGIQPAKKHLFQFGYFLKGQTAFSIVIRFGILIVRRVDSAAI